MRNVIELAKQLATRELTSGEPKPNTFAHYIIWDSDLHHNAAALGAWNCTFLPREGETIRVILDNPEFNDLSAFDALEKKLVHGRVVRISYEIINGDTYVHIEAEQF